MSRRPAAIGIALVAVVLVVVAAVRLASPGDDAEADALPAVDLVREDGSTLSTADLRGTPTVVNVWYSACAPCAAELREFAEVDDEYGDEVRFVGVNAIDTIEEMTEFAGERGVTYELLQDPLGELQRELRLSSFPTTLFVDADGRIVERTGVLDAPGLRDEVESLLSGAG